MKQGSNQSGGEKEIVNDQWKLCSINIERDNENRWGAEVLGGVEAVASAGALSQLSVSLCSSWASVSNQSQTDD